MCAPPGTLRVSHSAKRSASHWLIGVHLGPGIFLNGIARKNSSGHVLWQPTMKDRNTTAIAHSLWKLSKKHLAYHRIFVGCTQCGTLTMSVISRKTCAAIYIVSGARPSVPVSMPCRTAAMQTPTVSSPSVPRGWRSMAFCRTLCQNETSTTCNLCRRTHASTRHAPGPNDRAKPKQKQTCTNHVEATDVHGRCCKINSRSPQQKHEAVVLLNSSLGLESLFRSGLHRANLSSWGACPCPRPSWS